jgi:hypothetical protein
MVITSFPMDVIDVRRLPLITSYSTALAEVSKFIRDITKIKRFQVFRKLGLLSKLSLKDMLRSTVLSKLISIRIYPATITKYEVVNISSFFDTISAHERWYSLPTKFQRGLW